jgi:hypothetical protein
MQTKLTLRMDSKIIELAKKFAFKQGTSLSKLVSDLLELHINAETPANEGNSDADFEEAMQHPFMKKFIGAVENSNIKDDDYADFLEEKYK